MSQRSGEADLLAGEDASANDASEPRLRSVSPERVGPVERGAPVAPVLETPEAALPQGFVLEEGSIEQLLPRLTRLERRLRLQSAALLLCLAAGVYLVVERFLVQDITVTQTLMESKEFTLMDNDGTGRLFIRMYSKVPVLQIMDGDGNPRMSLGLRFDDTPFIDLSDRSGRTRATFEMTEDDSPALRLFDENGERTFNIN